MAGKTKQSGVKTSTDPKRESAKEIQANLLHGFRDWRMVQLRQRIEALRKAQLAEHKAMVQHEQETELNEWEALPTKDRESSKGQHERRVAKYDEALKQADEVFWDFPDNYLSARAARLADENYALVDELDAIWRDIYAQFERAVLDGNAGWFERQAKAIRSGESCRDTLNQFEAAVAHELGLFFWDRRAEQQKDSFDEAATLQPAGKCVGVTAQQVLDRFKFCRRKFTITKRKPKQGEEAVPCVRFCYRIPSGDEGNFVEHCFENPRRAREAIRRVARLNRYLLAE